jgi:uncharacterized paraquat-inducible protein A
MLDVYCPRCNAKLGSTASPLEILAQAFHDTLRRERTPTEAAYAESRILVLLLHQPREIILAHFSAAHPDGYWTPADRDNRPPHRCPRCHLMHTAASRTCTSCRAFVQA